MDVMLGKRMPFLNEDLGSTSRKRQKLHNVQIMNGPETINSAHSLRQLLSFRQDEISELRRSTSPFGSIDSEQN